MLLKKDERKALSQMLSDIWRCPTSVVKTLVSILTKEHHMHIFKGKAQLWDSLQSAEVFPTLVD